MPVFAPRLPSRASSSRARPRPARAARPGAKAKKVAQRVSAQDGGPARAASAARSSAGRDAQRAGPSEQRRVPTPTVQVPTCVRRDASWRPDRTQWLFNKMQLGRDRRAVRGPEPAPAPRHRYASSDDPHERVQEYRRAFERMRETVEFLLFEYYIEQEDRELRRIVAAVDRLPEPTPSYTWRPRPPAVQQPPEVHRLVRTAGVVVRSRRRRRAASRPPVPLAPVVEVGTRIALLAARRLAPTPHYSAVRQALQASLNGRKRPGPAPRSSSPTVSGYLRPELLFARHGRGRGPESLSSSPDALRRSAGASLNGKRGGAAMQASLNGRKRPGPAARSSSPTVSGYALNLFAHPPWLRSGTRSSLRRHPPSVGQRTRRENAHGTGYVLHGPVSLRRSPFLEHHVPLRFTYVVDPVVVVISYAPNVSPSSRPPCSPTAAIWFGRQRDGPHGPTLSPSPYWCTLWHVFNVRRARRHGDDAGRYVHAHEPILPAGMPGTPAADVEGCRCHGGRGRPSAGATDHLDLYCDWTCRRRRAPPPPPSSRPCKIAQGPAVTFGHCTRRATTTDPERSTPRIAS
ncbi:unnamed protein product (mitochondrion) [Plasmodiophora brassicae]|uniref:Uncharacterized protein n=1 Tax=Plasmodiophora brassicae TaxID=37360 RepID=A0A3P3XZ19_PLABS|nr:unnamed protein product [Plasmodiophora brassicae]